MNPQFQDVLAELLKKLGTTSEHLWPILVARARLDAYIWIIAGFSLGFAAAYGTYLLIRKYEEIDREFPALVVVSSCCMFSIFMLCMGISSITDAVYPEAAAIKHILNNK